MSDTYRLEDIDTAFDNGDVDPRKILDSDDPLETFYDEVGQSDDGNYEPQSRVAQEYLPRTEDLLD